MVIIDDEYLVRLGLSKTIDWSKYGVEIVGTAGDGKTGFELVEKEQPDLIISDIRMPFMNGVELIKKLSSAGFEGEIIVLTAYKDFDYAVETYKSGIFSYVLKPVENAEIIGVVQKALEKLNEKKKDQMMKSAYSSSINTMQSSYIESLLKGNEEKEEEGIKTHLSNLNISLPLKGSLVLLKEDNPSPSSEQVSLGGKIVEEYLKKALLDCVSFLVNGSQVFFINSEEKEEIIKHIYQSFLDLEKESEETFTLALTSYQSLTALPQAFNECLTYAENKLMSGFNTVETKNDDSISFRHYASIKSFYRLISEEYASPLTVSSVALKLGVSESYLMHLLKDSLGKTFNDILTDYRLSWAKKYLKEGKLRINEIAYKVGYPDEKYFSKVFKKETGVNPSEYH
jgi:two-component system response regulator YesN